MRSTLLDQQQNSRLASMSIAVVGCGGLGGVVADGLVRSGARHVTLIDNDCFDMSNSNRQLFSCVDSIGCNKAQYTADSLCRQLQLSKQDITAIDSRLTTDNINLLSGFELIFDCTDNVESKLLLEQYAIANNILLIHGSVDGYYGQVVLIDGVALLDSIYASPCDVVSNDYMSVCTVASVQLSVLYAYLCGRSSAGTLYSIDMLDMTIDSVQIGRKA